MKTSEAGTKVGEIGREVKLWLAKDDGVEASRPSHCAACGAAAYRGDGRLRLHGHGRRQRTVWGPQQPDGAPSEWDAWVRRYRCTGCRSVRTAARPGLGRRLRYSLCAIALALTAWAVWLLPATEVRARVSPFRTVGSNEAERWRSLRRWARRAAGLFGLPAAATVATPKEQAARAARLVRARGPTDRAEAERVFIGARVG